MALDLTGISQAFQGLAIGDAQLINLVAVVGVFLISIAITRHPNKILILQLPIAFSLNTIGLYVGVIPMVLYSVIFVLSSFSLSGIGDALSSGASGVGNIVSTPFKTRTPQGTKEYTGKTLFGFAAPLINRNNLQKAQTEEYATLQTQKAYNKSLAGQRERALKRGDLKTVTDIDARLAASKKFDTFKIHAEKTAAWAKERKRKTRDESLIKSLNKLTNVRDDFPELSGLSPNNLRQIIRNVASGKITDMRSQFLALEAERRLKKASRIKARKL